ncbi:MAG: GNAT family N-acetyltransferase [Candidatus Helarchaeota archaeon]|nr:GNAT family N-acetyltransferase [Candidatus Helarchaeota archaeon]
MPYSKEKLLQFTLNNYPAKFCFVSYDLLKMPEKCHIVGESGIKSIFIFKFLEYYVFYGSNCFNYFNDIPHEAGLVRVAFDQENLSNIQKHFQGFRITDISGEGQFNYFLNMFCNKSQLIRDLKILIEGVREITLEDWTNNAPIEIKTFLEQSTICYGLVQDGKLVSCAPSPELYLGENAPKFAIIRGVWTDPNFRRKGLATSSMKKLCLKLFDEVKVENIYLWVEERNPTAINIYKKLGFRVAGKWWGSQCYFR